LIPLPSQPVGGKNWTVEADKADRRTYEFRRASVWRQDEEPHPEGRRVGSRRGSLLRGDAVGVLPGLPLSVQVFVLAVVLTRRDSDAATAATARVTALAVKAVDHIAVRSAQ
jgi:hypothetical protein